MLSPRAPAEPPHVVLRRRRRPLFRRPARWRRLALKLGNRLVALGVWLMERGR